MGEIVKGIIKEISRKPWKAPDGKEILYTNLMIESDFRKFSIRGEGDIVKKMMGDYIEIDATDTGKDNKWNAKLVGDTSAPPQKPFVARGKSTEELKQMARTMSASYSKDLCVALINKEVISLKTLDTELIRLASLIHGWVSKE